MDYNFTQFDSTNFEHLIQSLMQKKLGDTSLVFGKGRDGARELTYEGIANYPNSINRWDGYWVVQAKFKSKDFAKENHFQWVKKNFKDELDKFKNTARNLRIPDNYIFFTNVVLTPVHEVGGRDKIEAIKKEYKNLIPNIFIGGYDELCRLLDNNRDVRLTYCHLYLPSDLIKKNVKLLEENNYEDYPEYKKLEEEIEKLRQENSVHQYKIFELRQQRIKLEEALKNIQTYITNTFNDISVLQRKAAWLFLIEKDIDKALELLNESHLINDEIKIAKARILRGKLLFAKMEFSDAGENFKKAVQIIDNYETNLEYGGFLVSMRDYQKALPFYKRAYQVVTENNKLALMVDLGRIYDKLGFKEDAERLYNEVFEITMKDIENFDFSNSQVLEVLLNLGNYYTKVNSQRAEKIYTDLIRFNKIIKKALSQDKINVINGNLGIFYYQKNDFEKAIKYLKLSINEVSLKDTNSLILSRYSHFNARLADVYGQLDDFENAHKYYLVAIEYSEMLAFSIPKIYLTKYGELLVDVSVLYRYFLEDASREISHFIKILEDFKGEWFNKIDCQLGSCYYHFGMIDKENGRVEASRRNLNMAKELLENSEQKLCNKKKVLELINESFKK